ncbi:MAG TPA: hypothetical protein VGB04_02490 [Allosphingosinicella sp.]|jgi:hypothetical protein
MKPISIATMALAVLPMLLGHSSAGAAETSRPTVSAALLAAPWSIAGIRLGMTPRQVADAVKRAGYVLDFRHMGRSWQGEVSDQVYLLRDIRIPTGADVVRKEDYKKGQEDIQVIYAVSPAGPYASRVTFRIDSDAIDAERFSAAARSRYGRPSIDWGPASLYCSAGERECARPGSWVINQLPHLIVSVEDGMTRSLELQPGLAVKSAFEAAIKAEAERLYPKKDKPSF